MKRSPWRLLGISLRLGHLTLHIACATALHAMVVAQAPACLLVANHVSWLDIFALNALTPARFVAKSEVSGWPVLGWLVQRVGTCSPAEPQERC